MEHAVIFRVLKRCESIESNMSQLLLNLNTVVAVLCFLMAIHLFYQRSLYTLAVTLLSACFCSLSLQALFLGFNLIYGGSLISMALQPVMPLVIAPLSLFLFKSAFDNQYRLTPAHVLHLTPAIVVLILMLDKGTRLYADFAIISSLLGYSLLLTHLTWSHKHKHHAQSTSVVAKEHSEQQAIYRWLVIVTAYSWLVLMGDVLIFFEIESGISSIQSIALLLTIIFKLLIFTGTTFLALQKSPSFDWLYTPLVPVNTKFLEPEKQQEFDNVIAVFEQLQPTVFTQQVMSLKAMADKLGIAPRLLSNAINHHYGESYTKRMNRLRVKVAEKLLLEQPNLSILTIMYEAGFQTKSSFNKEFKALNGVSPSEYRQTHLGQV